MALTEAFPIAQQATAIRYGLRTDKRLLSSEDLKMEARLSAS